MRNKRQTRPPQKLADSDYSVNNTKNKSQKTVSKKGSDIDVVNKMGSVGEGAKCEGSNRSLEDTGASMNGKEEGDECEGTENVVTEVVINADVNEEGDKCGVTKNVDTGVEDTTIVNEVVHEESAVQQEEVNGEKLDDKVHNSAVRNKSYAAATGNLNGLNKKLFAVPTEVDEDASRLGNPLVMDSVTSDMCRLGVGRIGYARVLVEVSAKKCLPELIEVVYRDRDKTEICRKVVKVVTEWIPSRCSECCVFGHSDKSCGKIVSNEKQEIGEQPKESEKERNKVNVGNDNEGYEEVRYKRNYGGWNNNRTQNFKQNTQFQRKGEYMNKNKTTHQVMYQKKKQDVKQDDTSKNQIPVKDKTPVKEAGSTSNKEENNNKDKGSNNSRGAWNVRGEILDAFKRSANKYAMLDPDGSDNATISGSKEAKDGCSNEENDVYNDENGIAQCMGSDDIEGRDKGVLN
ncbi:ATPase, F1/V1/A1 complex, alpha/beta subunit, Zinc knuckle CX2CX4HX4C [Artemisia annua]|uniref:ATPase, F1/V1/A1 complex, alpha/beta subunit, Zinc knuckle CX2CX4HX4C n=1 Tax=Artemisia annua TaxID=35608 RepID=A0A2U1N039_ARTAN|nr:ATPase, F1/V1/A1 complex, alpha/beta subunit, Zinc knuckle CX2CX4HX4C [Artemisia annua]